MRRPSPLPPPVSPRAEQPRSAAPDSREQDAGSARADLVPPPSRAPRRPAATGEDESVAVAQPVAVLPPASGAVRPDAPGGGDTSPTTDDVGRGADADAEAGADADAEAGADAIGIRDVWRAARARRRALRAEVRRFTVRQRRRRAIWLGVTSSLVLLVLGTLGAAYSPLFAVEEITVVGASQLDAATVEDALDGQLGTALPLVDSSAIKAALVGFPLVESYTLEARPPHDLVVRIVERTPIGVVSSPAGFTLVDAAGVALSTTAEPPSAMPVIDAKGGTGSAAFEAIGLVMRSLPESIDGQVTAVSATTPNDVTLTLGGTRTSIVWGGADDSALKARSLESTMIARPPADVSVYDVSSPAAVVVH